MNSNGRIIILLVVLLLLLAITFHFSEKQKESELAMLKSRLAFVSSNRVQQELVHTPSSFAEAIDITMHVKRRIEAAEYKELNNRRYKEKFVQSLFSTASFKVDYSFAPEQNNGRGPVDFVIAYGKDQTQIEVKMASNSKLKQVAKQVSTYASANGILNTVIALIYTTEKQRLRAEKIMGQITFDTNTEVIYIDGSPNKLSASKVC